ncbi:MAG: hypothetical protein LBM71_02855 [Elusimicrobiota bacterium]|jgi:hypothetical protein|nr:hypothetical protein [Elusimicrobiota bacterium]
MKIIKLLLLSFIFCACSGAALKKTQEPLRSYPVFLQNGQSSAAFKIDFKAMGGQYGGVLLLSRKSDTNVEIRVLADFATRLAEASFDGSKLNFTYILQNTFDAKTTEIFEDIIKVLLVPPQNFTSAYKAASGDGIVNFKSNKFMQRYYFKKGISYPYKLEEIKTIVKKKFLFEDYTVYGDTSLPSVIICKDAHNIAELKLTLISVK